MLSELPKRVAWRFCCVLCTHNRARSVALNGSLLGSSNIFDTRAEGCSWAVLLLAPARGHARVRALAPGLGLAEMVASRCAAASWVSAACTAGVQLTLRGAIGRAVAGWELCWLLVGARSIGRGFAGCLTALHLLLCACVTGPSNMLTIYECLVSQRSWYSKPCRRGYRSSANSCSRMACALCWGPPFCCSLTVGMASLAAS